ncbi:MAG: hypothetical protein AABX28_00180 [Nanoarchaeota archaeon]
MAEYVAFKYFETEEEFINHLIKCGSKLEDILEGLVHEKAHAKKARELGYTDVKYGFRITSNRGKIIDFRYLTKVEGVTPEDAMEIAKAPEDPGKLDKRLYEIASVSSALDKIGYPKGYIPEDYIEK